MPWPGQVESSPKKANIRFLIPQHRFWAILVLAPWKQRHNCSFKRLLKFPLQNTLIKGLYFVFSLWEGDEKLGYFMYFNASFRDWCTESTNATSTVKKSILMKLSKLGAIKKSSYVQLSFKFLGYLLCQSSHWRNTQIETYIWLHLIHFIWSQIW